MDQTPRLNLPYIAAQQGLRQVTFNEAMAVLDTLVQPAVASCQLTSPPSMPAAGETHIVADGASGAWAGQDGRLASYRDGAWQFRAPAPGWLAYVADEAAIVIFRDGAWDVMVSHGGGAVPRLGINTSADGTNRFAVASAASLFTHDGADHRLVVDKAGPGDTASIIWQAGGSGRAEIGLTGDDDLRIKLSPDGAAWSDALIAHAEGIGLASGRLGFPASANPSADPHTLDDYREGSFSPGLTFANAAVGLAYGSQNGARYTKIGRHCWVSGTLHLSARGSSTGQARLTGLPFAAMAGAVWTPMTVGYAAGVTVTGGFQGIVGPASTEIVLYQGNSGASSALQHTNFTNGSIVYFALSYDVG